MRLMNALALAAVLAVAASAAAAEPSLTVYNDGFAVVRETIPLTLTRGTNTVSTTGITAFLEPNSVILRDPAERFKLRILEQNYRSEPVSQALLLSRFEGQTIDFLVRTGTQTELKRGKIIRGGYLPNQYVQQRYGQQYYYQGAYGHGGGNEPLIEMDGTLRFGLPGQPLFPALTTDDILKPTLDWTLASDQAGACAAELAYVTGGMSWSADYNVVAPERGNTMDLVGWVTVDNQTGRTFADARLKLVAGDVNKLQPGSERNRRGAMFAMAPAAQPAGPQFSERAFDEYHLYTLERPTTLRDRETKQVEFIRAGGIQARQLLIYDGAQIDRQRYQNWGDEQVRNHREYGTECNPKVWVMREFANSEANHLGIPLPRGRMRFYRRDRDGQLEFTGENVIDHTPKDETVRVYTGNAFDLVGERSQTQYQVNNQGNWADESFEITLRNHRAEAAEVRVVEHLYRCRNWTILKKTAEFRKTDSRTIEFTATVPPNGEQVITYTVHYTW